MEARLHGLDYGPSTAPVAPEATTREEKLALNKRCGKKWEVVVWKWHNVGGISMQKE